MPAIRSAAGALALLMSFGTTALAQGQGILGLWTTDKGKGRVESSNAQRRSRDCAARSCGSASRTTSRASRRPTRANKNASLRNRPIIGLQIFEGWKEAGANKWTGPVYDPEDGQSYDVDITLAGDKLTLKGCIAFLCDSDTWDRYRGR